MVGKPSGMAISGVIRGKQSSDKTSCKRGGIQAASSLIESPVRHNAKALLAKIEKLTSGAGLQQENRGEKNDAKTDDHCSEC